MIKIAIVFCLLLCSVLFVHHHNIKLKQKLIESYKELEKSDHVCKQLQTMCYEYAELLDEVIDERDLLHMENRELKERIQETEDTMAEVLKDNDLL